LILINGTFYGVLQDLKEAIVKGLGFPLEDFKISGFDPREAEVGHSVQYEFDVEIDHKIIPFKLLEDVNRWEYVDLPIFRVEKTGQPGEENGLVEKKSSSGNGNGLPVLAPFQLAGPMELWIQDAKDMRISLPVSPFSPFLNLKLKHSLVSAFDQLIQSTLKLNNNTAMH